MKDIDMAIDALEDAADTIVCCYGYIANKYKDNEKYLQCIRDAWEIYHVMKKIRRIGEKYND